MPLSPLCTEKREALMLFRACLGGADARQTVVPAKVRQTGGLTDSSEWPSEGDWLVWVGVLIFQYFWNVHKTRGALFCGRECSCYETEEQIVNRVHIGRHYASRILAMN